MLYTKTIIHLSVGESGGYLPPLRWIIVSYNNDNDNDNDNENENENENENDNDNDNDNSNNNNNYNNKDNSNMVTSGLCFSRVAAALALVTVITQLLLMDKINFTLYYTWAKYNVHI